MRGRESFARVEPWLLRSSTLLRGTPLPFRLRMIQRARGVGGRLGQAIRYVLLNSIGTAMLPNVSVREDVYLFSPERLQVGENVSIHPMCYIDAAGGIKIGNDVSIAHGTTIMSSSHTFKRNDLPIKDQQMTLSKTVIEDNCWIGAQVVLLAGVHVGEGSVVAANSVVNRSVPAGSVVAGSPAKIIDSRVLGHEF